MHARRALVLVAALAVPMLGAQANAPRTARSGADVYQVYCALCHSGGWQGAPLANDASEWKPRLEKGAQAVLTNVKNGLNGMPPMGTCTDCSDDELRAAIEEMTRS